MIYAACKKFDEICMYLSLRSDNVDIEDETTGTNVFSIYLERKDINRMQQLLMRRADVNFCGQSFLTPLHRAIDKRLPVKVVKFLLK